MIMTLPGERVEVATARDLGLSGGQRRVISL
jgi:hypothetical protein